MYQKKTLNKFEMLKWAKDIFLFRRSLAGEENWKTLNIEYESKKKFGRRLKIEEFDNV